MLIKNKGISSILFNPQTGKTHQLRIVSKNLGCPIVGDNKYNIIKQKKKNEKKLMLHAYKIKFLINNKKFNFEAKPPSYFNNFLNKKRLII